MGFVDNEVFLEELLKLYKLSKTKKCGSVWVTFKQAHLKKEIPGLGCDGCLVRATNGSKKFATIVKPKEVGKFNSKLTAIMNTQFGLQRLN
ncbi:signal recognition particle 14 kD protein [Entamoeba histolytica HM-3:IMSS]|uniref:Signal recognition particle 14 kDa protein n=3 Tax=Entamoeba histolytica TaxID=5759 RepID=A0A175JL08_ENTHI|nr:signal recognition particle 14 kD protein, putative [Entamoeba histolytica KU27]EMS16232.1 signal recognition particle 14 kD protein [Entamoeba histolytica HM-3:IMSS]GAT94390.1 signal recognition particle 14 domain containing protein [Entamoeba histolytica]